ncbi:hypothetical protein [Gluconobacter cerinus]|uniref:hypothetical protein n=1 Tax=Gluconobacter cerinus TaxID=38307 RepID=UPI001B8DA59A|nr:hypothetical protein [Gluconobacter cerinus]MBS0984134.1 hypothetical protein [Gluconobacter cerinus]
MRGLSPDDASKASRMLDVEVPTLVLLEIMDDFKNDTDCRDFGRHRSSILKANNFRILDDPSWLLYKNGSLKEVSPEKEEEKSISEDFVKLILDYNWNEIENRPINIYNFSGMERLLKVFEHLKDILESDKRDHLCRIRSMWNDNPLNFNNNPKKELNNEIYFSILKSYMKLLNIKRINYNNIESDFAFYVGCMAYNIIKYGKKYGEKPKNLIPLKCLEYMDGNDFMDSMIIQYISLRNNKILVTCDKNIIDIFSVVSNILATSNSKRLRILSKKTFCLSLQDFKKLIS